MQPEARQQLERTLLDLLSRVADRLTPENQEFARDLIEAHGEYGVAMEMMADWLIEDDTPITSEEWALAHESSVAMGTAEGTMEGRLKSLRVADPG